MVLYAETDGDEENFMAMEQDVDSQPLSKNQKAALNDPMYNKNLLNLCHTG